MRRCFARCGKSSHFLLFLLVFLVVAFSQSEAQGLQPPAAPPGVVPIYPVKHTGLWQFFVDSTLFRSRFLKFSRKVIFDSTGQFVDIEEKLYDKDYRLPIRMSTEYYLTTLLRLKNRELFRQRVINAQVKQMEISRGGIELNIPVRIRNKTFRRIFGGDRVGLTVSGNISFELSGRTESRSGSAVNSFQQKNIFSPKFRQTQQLNVQGHVGDKVKVSVNQNSEATFDLENTLKLTYDGDEDDIVRKIQAGNVSLSLPSTKYVSVSAKNEGLFGLKTELQMGNLSFTGIASLQRGEKEKLNISGSAEENTLTVSDIQYVRDRFFLVDTLYADNFSNFDENMTFTTNEDWRIVQLDVWKKVPQSEEGAQPALAVLNPDEYIGKDLDSFDFVPGKIEKSYFKRLVYGQDYWLDEYQGFFWLRERVGEQDVIAVAYKRADGTVKGTLYQDVPADSQVTILLKLVKPQASKPEYRHTWRLAMRNVYNLGVSNVPLEGFDVKVVYSVTGEDQEIEPKSKLTYNYLMGLDRLNEQGEVIEGGDKKIDLSNGWIFRLKEGYLIFPILTPFAPPPNSKFYFDSTKAVKIYNIKDPTEERRQHKFNLLISTKSVKTNYNLGFNILENSVVVRLNGRTLTEGKDYTVDYFSGQLNIIADEARRPDAQIEIEYERGSLFQLDKKTLLGGRFQYDLGRNKFIGFTTLFYSQSTIDQRIRLGQEPIRNFIWDINGAFEFKPNFISKGLDKLPIVETSAESHLKLEMEYAQVNPNPNTFNMPELGENKGVAYIDDFEGSKRSTPLGIPYRIWSFASVPLRFRIPDRNVDFSINPYTQDGKDLILKMDRARVKFNWYNPFEPVPIKDIWPNKDVNTQTGTTTTVLEMKWINEDIPVDSAWAGIMRSTVSFPDQKKTKYIELWVKGTTGRINIDIGHISEDYWVRGVNYRGLPSLGNLNTEDVNFNTLLDEGEDVGIDGIPDGQPGDDPDDNFVGPEDAIKQNLPHPFYRINGTEGNGDPEKGVQGVRAPDTEDLNGDGDVNTQNDYFAYSFDLADENNPYIKGRTSAGWRLYRIPIRDYDFKVGNPDTNFQEIFYVRLWLNNLEPDGEFHTIQIATFDFVGNEWEEKGLALTDTSNFQKSDTLFTLDVYNTEENVEAVEGGPEPYHSPPNVTGIVDRITRARSKEQSLVLRMKQLPAGAKVEALKQLNSSINMINYGKLKMFVHGDWMLPKDDPPLEFFIRFGPTEQVYYEYTEPVYPHWDERNNIEIDFKELTDTKQEKYLLADSANGLPVFFREDPNYPGKTFKVVGYPSLHKVNYFVIGVRNKGTQDLQDIEVWVDELRVTDVERESGNAMRLSANLQMADVGQVNASWELVDDNFRRLEQKYANQKGPSGFTRLRQIYNSNFRLNKFLPQFLKVEIPVHFKYDRNVQVPKYYYNSDRRTFFRPDNMFDRVKTFLGLNALSPELEANSNISESRSFGFSFKRKNEQRDPWYLKYSINRLNLSVNFVQVHRSSPTQKRQDNAQISGQISYSVQFPRDKFFTPFAWLGKGRLVRALARQKLYYLPSSIAANASLTDNENVIQNRLEPKPTITPQTATDRSFQMSYKMLESLDMRFNRRVRSDAWYKKYRARDVMKAIFDRLDFGLDKNVTQNFNLNYRPNFFNIFRPTYSYQSQFTYSIVNPKRNDRTSRLNISQNLQFSIEPADLINRIYNPKLKQKKPPKKKTGFGPKKFGPGKSKKTPTQGKTGKDKTGKDKQQDQQEKKGFRPPNLLHLLHSVLTSWKSINVRMVRTENYQHFLLKRMPDWRYQLGLNRDPRAGVDTTFNKLFRLPSISKRDEIKFDSQFLFSQYIQVNLNYAYSLDRRSSNQQDYANFQSGYFFMGDDPQKGEKTWWQYVPDWGVRVRGLEKIPFLKKYVKTMTMEHSRNGKFQQSLRYEGDEEFRDSWTYTNSYQPFFALNINTVWGVNVTLRYNTSQSYNYSSNGTINANLTSSFDASAKYSLRKGFSLPIPFLKKKKLKNEMDLTVTFNRTSSLNQTKRPGTTEYVVLYATKNTKFRPQLTYRFSQRVTGSAFFERGITENVRTGRYSYFEFGINVNIAIR